MLASKVMQAVAGGAEKIYVDDVFTSWVRTGTGADVTITTSIDMTQGYMLWTKGRSGATDHALYHSARGVTLDLATNTTAAQTTQTTGLKSVSSTGHTNGALAKMNTNGETYVDWVVRNADKFYNHTVVTKSAGSNATVSFPGLSTLGMVRVKRTDSTGSWYIWHRSLSTGQLLIGETTEAAATLGHITVSGTTVTLVNGVIADGTYLVEGFAHDTSTDGIIQCESFTTNGSGNATVNLGWEPQYLMCKRSDSTSDWMLLDTMRRWTVTNPDNELYPNQSNAESTANRGTPTATGFTQTLAASATYIYLAIRRPNKPPTTGTQVYNAIARTGTGAAATVTGVGFAPDLVIVKGREVVRDIPWTDRLRGVGKVIQSNSTLQESVADGITAFTNSGVVIGLDAWFNQSAINYINYFFRRAPGVFDVVCYTGTGSATTVAHNLGAVPELMIVKGRSFANNWMVYINSVGNTKGALLNTSDAPDTDPQLWNNTSPTASVFTVGNAVSTNTNAASHVAYLFASLPGIAKVGSYTGNGSNQTINCGFSTGARFVLIKRTDSTGDWYVWDTARGIVSANDPHLSLNTTAAEVTTDDSVDPDSTGFIVNQVTATNINVNGATYIYLAFA